ncbi:BatD family protein [Methanolobus mangrovi]|uniref:BatD family protein n=1 Tax=Methanolobus mangrovi TaxID=3072977 RepID=A0AA51UGE6_9EURY|nr:BatD family protein [Methanolobus mangrovi]WMW22723.1 BatD family protein [Methanolobus mangrovi]
MLAKKVFYLSFIVFILFTSSAMAYTVDDIEWSDSSDASGTLHWGGTLKCDEYTIKAEDFNEGGYVSIGIYRDGQLQKKSPARAGEGFEFRDTEKGDDLRIFVKTVTLNIDEWTGNMEDPTVAIEVYERGIPEMDIVIEPEQDTYDPRTISYPTIIATIAITNEGDAKAYDMDVDIDVDGMELIDGKLSHHLISIDEDEVLDPIEIKLEIPHYWEETDVDITVTTRSEDINGEIHEDVETETITIEPVVELMITKSATEEIYMDETAHVSVSIWNNGIYSLSSVSVTNPTTGDLEIQDSVDNEVTLSFTSKETKAKVFEYTLKPTKTGKYSMPAATATFTAPDGKEYTFTSEKPTIQIDGPDIVLTKDVSPSSVNPGDDVTVKVTVKNQGTRDASVHTSETIPEDVVFLSGDLSFDDVAVHGKTYSYSYVLKVNEIGELKLPATTGTFIDFEDYKGEKISNMPIITVLDPSPEPEESTSASSSGANTDQQVSTSDQGSTYTSDIAEDRVEPGFEASFMILALFGVYFVSRRKDRS